MPQHQQLAQEAVRRSLKMNQILIMKDEPVEHVYLIERGSLVSIVDVADKGEGTKVSNLDFLENLDFFYENS